MLGGGSWLASCAAVTAIRGFIFVGKLQSGPVGWMAVWPEDDGCPVRAQLQDVIQSLQCSVDRRAKKNFQTISSMSKFV